MSSITATVDAARGAVRLDIDLSDADATNVVVSRVNLTTGASVYLRGYGSVGGSTVLLPAGAVSNNAPTTLAGRLVLWDTEAPLDTPLQYTAAFSSGTTLVTLNTNPYFENGAVSPWTPQNNSSLLATNGQFHQGGWSLQVIPDGVTAVPQVQSEEMVATAGKSYLFNAWLRTTSNATRTAGLFWFDAAHAFLAANTISTALVAGTWTQYTATYVAPANAAFVRIKSNDPATPAAGNPWQIDEATVSSTVAVSTSSSVVILPSNGYGWLRDPLRPANNLRLDMNRVTLATLAFGGQGVAWMGGSDLDSAANSGVFNINNSAYPSVVVRPREAPTGQFRMLARSPGDVSGVDQLLAAGGALLLQLPSAYAEADRYVVAGNTKRSYVFADQRRPRRLFTVPFATVLAPVGAPQGLAGIRWMDLCNHTATWGALYAATGGTYDAYGRTVGSGGWGAPDVPPVAGTSWTVAGTAADFSVSAGQGRIAASVVNSSDRATIGSQADSEQYLTFTAPVLALGAPYQVAVLARHADSSNYYRLGVQFNTDSSTTLFIIKRVAAAETTVTSTAGPTYAAGQIWHIHAAITGTSLNMSGWKDGTPEPVEYSRATSDGSLVGANPFGIFLRLNTGNTNVLPVTVTVDDYMVKGAVTWQGILDGAVA